MTLCLRVCLLATAQFLCLQASQTDDRKITQVITLLQDMLDKSKDEGNLERDLYAKYKCYHDTEEDAKLKAIEEHKLKIGLLESQIEGLLSSTSILSKELAKVKQDIAANKAAQGEATAVRNQEETEFNNTRDDLNQAMDQLTEAIKELADVGADQTLNTARAHTQYMAGHQVSMTALKSSVKQALFAAGTFMGTKEAARLNAFIQKAPFTGTYSAQSGEVVGILKDMFDTFESNLAAATATEEKAKEAYNNFMGTKAGELFELEALETEKTGLIASNDLDLAAKRSGLDTEQTGLSDAETFLSELRSMYGAKTKQYDERVALRTQEDAAISEAIAILNSDAAFDTFGTVTATNEGRSGSFLQFQAIHRHDVSSASPEMDRRIKTKSFLQKYMGSHKSPLLGRIVSMLQANNPFTVVLAEIDKMLDLIQAEEKADNDQKSWCDAERTETDSSITEKGSQITTLNNEINGLHDTIDHPETGLRKSIADTELALQQNSDSQVSETATRKEENLAYQKDIANLVEAGTLLTRGIAVLKQYYAQITAELNAGFLQQKSQNRRAPAPPATWEDTYKGQSVKGAQVLQLLEGILSDTQSEESDAHTAEMQGQHAYEDSMSTLKQQEADALRSLATLKGDLASALESLFGKQKDLKTTETEKAKLEAYLEEIKAGCDFITSNIDARKANRQEEIAALNTAKAKLEGTPTYIKALAEKHNETLGDCLSICAGAEDHVDCKACLAKISVPGYCAGHPGTEGC